MDEATRLLSSWGALPPLDGVTPAMIERAQTLALAETRAAHARIAADTASPTIANTFVALDLVETGLERVEAIRMLFASTRATPEMTEANARMAPRAAQRDDVLVRDAALFDRLAAAAVTAQGPAERALATAWLRRLRRSGAGLPEDARQRLATIRARLAAQEARFAANLVAEQDSLVVWATAEQLDGLPEIARDQASRLAIQRGRPGECAIGADRPSVMAVLGHAHDRALRQTVWTMWFGRGTQAPHDNRLVVAEILRLRGEMARVLGYPTYAACAFDGRMAKSADTARAQLRRVWARVRAATAAHIESLAALARAEGIDPLEPWDRRYYAERLKADRFGFDPGAVRDHLPLDRVVAAAMDAAARLHGLAFVPLDIPAHHPDARAYAVTRAATPLGTLVLDLVQRPGKQYGSWQQALRPACATGGAISVICSGNPPARAGAPVLMAWEHANVFFHEFGHAVHMLLGRAPWPSTGSLAVPWDFIETPALLNERWLDRAALARFARHHATGAPMPAPLLDSLMASVAHDRVFSLTLDYLAIAFVDLALHDAADGGEVDASAVEEQVLAALDLPRACDPMMRVHHAVHIFMDTYAAGVYSYLWSDVLAADIAEAFTAAPGGLFDAEVARCWRDTLLAVGATIDPAEGFRAFRGRDPDEGALLRRFALA